MTTVADLVRRFKLIMFPNNGYPAPLPPDPTIEEQNQIRDLLERRLVELGESKSNTLLLVA
jgi:hypothetical protein